MRDSFIQDFLHAGILDAGILEGASFIQQIFPAGSLHVGILQEGSSMHPTLFRQESFMQEEPSCKNSSCRDFLRYVQDFLRYGQEFPA